MVASASLIPCGVNVKCIFRHSFRPPLHNSINPDNVLLSEEGKRQAIAFGVGIEYKLGSIHSSYIQRCQQTVQYILKERHDCSAIILSQNELSNIFATNKEEADKTIIEYSLKGVVYKLCIGETLRGLQSIDYCVTNILDYIFNTGNEANTIDLYCTHDFHLAMIYAMLLSENKAYDDIVSNWPNMLEGMFFWGTRNDFHCLWRRKYKHIENNLIL